ncbi:MAG: DUF362 domain-containing protein [Lachnospiraceae bacterium]|nr:DUF362 domain-containing protein [Lachnospiraceae bacterium]
MAKIYEIYGHDAHEMTKSLMSATSIADIIPKDASIALKPNLVVADVAENGATTHPGVLSGCIEYLKENGFNDISIIESSWVGETTERSLKVSGCDRICEKYGVPFYDLKKDKVRRVDTPFRTMEIACRAIDADFLIDLPVLKGHCQTVMTCALKNLKGCLPDHEKRRFHTDGLLKPIAALASVLKPDLVIVDSICGDLDFEEGGNPVQTNRMMLGTDAVQIDAYGCTLMGLKVDDVPYIRLAESWGAGNTKVDSGDIIRVNEPTQSHDYPAASGKVKNLVRNVSADSACSACYASLVRALYRADKEGVRVNKKIFIGQGYQGKELNGIGIGRCCRGAKTCIMGCPPTADAILEHLRETAVL